MQEEREAIKLKIEHCVKQCAYEINRKENIIILHTQHRALPTSIPILTKGKEWEHEIKRSPKPKARNKVRKNRKN